MKLLIIFPILLCLLAGCSMEKLGKQAGTGVASTTDSIGHGLTKGVVDELTSADSRVKITRLLDSIVNSVAQNLTTKTLALRDSVVTKKIILWVDSLVEAATGNKSQLNLKDIQYELIGKTKLDLADMSKMVTNLIDQILSNNTKGKIAGLRDELLGPKTNLAITRIADTLVSHIVDSALAKLSTGYRKEIDPLVTGDIETVKRNAAMLIGLVGAIAIAIIVLVWINRLKYLRLTALLTKHINDIPDQDIYNQVTGRIHEDAITTGLEKSLRGVLSDNGLLGNASWQTKVQKMKSEQGRAGN
jgi:hypothetical protein